MFSVACLAIQGDVRVHPKKINRSSSSANTTASNLVPRGLRIEQAAAYAGTSCWFIRQAIWDGKLPARTGGKFLIILRDDLDAFLEALPLAEQNTAAWLKSRREKSVVSTAESEQMTP
jgi:excisionase family DNA binding protein